MAIIVGGALWPSRRLALVSKLGAFLWFITLGVSWGTMIGEGVLFIFSPSTEWSIPLLATWVLVTGFALLMSLVLPAALANTYGKLGFYDL